MKKMNIAAILALFGTLLILINCLIVSFNGSSIVIYSHSISSIDELLQGDTSLWYRISLGIPSFCQGIWIAIWLTISILNLFCAAYMLFSPEKVTTASLFVIIFSVLSLFSGGGFIIGFVLAAIGGLMGIQKRVAPSETFVGKILRAARFDSKLFEILKAEPRLIRDAVSVVILVGVLSAIGCGLYIQNMNRITESIGNSPIDILLLGNLYFDIHSLRLPSIWISLTFIKWLVLSAIIYIIGGKLLKLAADYDATARATAFAMVPLMLQFFMPIVFPNQPYLTVQWPLIVWFITNIWAVLVLIVATGKVFDISLSRALGLVLVSCAIYWLLVYEILLPFLFSSSGEIVGIYFVVNPKELIFGLSSLAILIAYVLGTFTRRG